MCGGGQGGPIDSGPALVCLGGGHHTLDHGGRFVKGHDANLHVLLPSLMLLQVIVAAKDKLRACVDASAHTTSPISVLCAVLR